MSHPDSARETSSVTAEGTSPPWRKPPGKIIIVLPAYNEEENLGDLLEQIDQVMYEDGFNYLVIVCDDGSSDDTLAVAEEKGRFIPLSVKHHEVNQGLGATIRDGLLAANDISGEQDTVVVMDADNTHSPSTIRGMVRRIQEGADVVIASRYQTGALVRGVPLFRRFLSWAASWLLRVVFPISGVRDYTCGFRAYRGPILKEAFERYGQQFIDQDGFQCMVDILLKLRKLDLVFVEVPFILRYDRKDGHSKMNVGRTIRDTLLLLLQRRLGR